MKFYSKISKCLIFVLIVGILNGCGGGKTRQLTDEERIWMPRDREKMKKVKAGRGLLTDFFLRRSDDEQSYKASNKKTNHLWSASLQILSNFPLASIDNNSGLIVTDWYISENKPSERFKITVLILDNKIEASSVKVSIYKQIIKNSRWINIDIEDKKTAAIERKIINKAIDLKSKNS